MNNVENLMNVKIQNKKLGGQEKIDAQHNLGKMTCRERINKVLDDGSFIELGGLIKKNGAGVITGYGTIEGRLVYIYSEDYTVDGGAINTISSEKICSIMDMALKMGAPLIQVLDSVGAKISEGLDILNSYAKIINRNAKAVGVIPQVALVLGPCEGIAALTATMSDFVIMTKDNSSLCMNSSDKITQKEETFIDNSSYASVKNTSENGSINIMANDEEEAFKLVRKIMEYIPLNNMENAPLGKESCDLNMNKERLNVIASSEQYDIYEVINEISDKNTFIELNSKWKENLVTGICKVNGLTIGLVANNKSIKEGMLSIASSEKLAKFVKMCDCFNIPLVSLVDTKGFEVSLEQELKGIVSYASKMVYCLSQAVVPKISLIIGEIYGPAYMILASKESCFDICYAWPCAKISLTEPKEIIKILYREEIISGDNPNVEEKKVIDKYINDFISPYVAAEKGYVDDIIVPCETKQRLFAMLDMLQTKRELRYSKKQGITLV